MKTIKLTQLNLRNFKGIKEFHLDLANGNAKIYGDNATGKTSIYDSFLWLLFNKDSNNRADFAIKTLDENGKEINNLEHEVEASFEVDGQPLTLKKIYKEKYTKKRGQATAEFTGHETNHYIDDVPVKKKEYEDKIKSLVDEEVFKLITSPTYFNEALKWQDRRKTLLEICGDIELDDVVKANNKLIDLPTILQNRTVEDHKKVIAERRKSINKELDMIPVRIDEIEKSTPEQVDAAALEVELKAVEGQLDEKATEINNIKNGAAIVDKEALAKQLELELQQLQNELEAEAREEGYKVQARLQEESSNLSILKRKSDDLGFQIEIKNKDVQVFDEKLVELREQWAVVNAEEYEHKHGEGVCPTCNQDLPAEQIEEAEQKAIAEFNANKSKRIEEVNEKGKQISEDKKEALEAIDNLKKEFDALDPQIKEKEKLIKKLEEKLQVQREAIKEARDSQQYLTNKLEIEETKKEIESLKENAQQAVVGVEKEVEALRIKRNELNSQLAQQAQIEANAKRVTELEQQQKDLAEEFEKLEHELFLTEEFTRLKVELLEERINSKFKFARFKLFEEQINGGLKEVCETTMNGVPYGSGLNNAAKINVGLDIINTLTAHYGIQAPIFVDNAEAVTQLIDTDSQLISLVVSEPDKELRIEVEKQSESEVA